MLVQTAAWENPGNIAGEKVEMYLEKPGMSAQNGEKVRRNQGKYASDQEIQNVGTPREVSATYKQKICFNNCLHAKRIQSRPLFTFGPEYGYVKQMTLQRQALLTMRSKRFSGNGNKQWQT